MRNKDLNFEAFGFNEVSFFNRFLVERYMIPKKKNISEHDVLNKRKVLNNNE